MKTFTQKKINENLFQTEKLNIAVVMPDGTLFVHEHGGDMVGAVYEHREDFCDVTEIVRDWLSGADNKANTVRRIVEEAKDFYEDEE